MYANVLTEAERDFILAGLKTIATDEILLGALREAQSLRELIQHDLKDVMGKKNIVPVTKPLKSPLNAADNVVRPVPLGPPFSEPFSVAEIVKETVGPPGEAAKRISKAAYHAITTELLLGPATTRDINEKLNGTLSNTGRIMKLLWQRKIVKYVDGKFIL